MIEFISLLVISAGALLVTIASIFRLAWLAVIVPTLIAAAAAGRLFVMSRRSSRHLRRPADRTGPPSRKSPRMAA